MHLESSGQWPDHIQALRRLKAAFYLRLAECLGQQAHIPAVAQRDCLLVNVVRVCEVTFRGGSGEVVLAGSG